jgi:hypothetical protein
LNRRESWDFLYAKLGKERGVATLLVSGSVASSLSVFSRGLVGIGVRVVVARGCITVARGRISVCRVTVLVSLALPSIAILSIRNITSIGCGGGCGSRIKGGSDQSCSDLLVCDSLKTCL